MTGATNTVHVCTCPQICKHVGEELERVGADMQEAFWGEA